MINWLVSTDGLLVWVALPALFNWLLIFRAIRFYAIVRTYRYMTFFKATKSWACISFPFSDSLIRAPLYETGVLRKDVLKLALMRSIPVYSLLVVLVTLIAALFDGVDSLRAARSKDAREAKKTSWSLRDWLNARVM